MSRLSAAGRSALETLIWLRRLPTLLAVVAIVVILVAASLVGVLVIERDRSEEQLRIDLYRRQAQPVSVEQSEAR